MLKRLLLFNIFLLISLMAFSKPARPGRIHLMQPDGSGFYARFYGDEMMRIKVTEGGESIIQNEDGWWCYAEYDASGRKLSTGCHVGGNVPHEVLSRSREIPFAKLTESVSLKKSYVRDVENRDRDILRRIKSGTRAGESSPSAKYGLVLLVQFKGQNEKMTYTKSDFQNMLMQEGYSAFGADGSAKEYFDDQFQGLYDFSFEVADVVTLEREMAYYGGNDSDGSDKNPHMMVIEACQLADAKIDFAKYDQDGDKEVDNVFVFFAGADEAEGASEDHIWSHAWYIKDGAGRNLILDGVRINRYACASELSLMDDYITTTMTSIGTFCHEYAHTFGLPDMYDTDYQVGGLAAGTWLRTSLMDGGNYNNYGNTPPNLTAVERDYLKLTEPEILTKAGKYTVESVDKGRYFRIDSDNEGEYFLIECRNASGWDRFIGGSGMLLYHIDRSMNAAGYSDVYGRNVTALQRWGESNEVNAYASHQCADLVEADGRPDIFSNVEDESYLNYLRSPGGIFFPYGRVNSLTPTSIPGFECWGNGKVDKAVSDIRYENGKVTFNFTRFSEEGLPIPSDLKVDIFQDAAIITFSCSSLFDGKAVIECRKGDEVIRTVDVAPYETGQWAYLWDGLDYSTSYTINVKFVDGDYSGDQNSISFMTKSEQKSGYPYLYLGNVERADDGAFPLGTKIPLRLFNAKDAKKIRWTFNGNPVTVGTDCYYTITKKGTLRAYITWEDGSEEVVMKEINIGEIENE